MVGALPEAKKAKPLKIVIPFGRLRNTRFFRDNLRFQEGNQRLKMMEEVEVGWILR